MLALVVLSLVALASVYGTGNGPELTGSKPIGVGTTSVIWPGLMKDSQVAIKVFMPHVMKHGLNLNDMGIFNTLTKNMKLSTRNRYVVRTLGFLSNLSPAAPISAEAPDMELVSYSPSKAYTRKQVVAGLVSERCDGTFEDLFTGPNTANHLGDISRYFADALDALSAVHDAGVCHGDLNLGNFFLCPVEGVAVAKLGDFGNSRKCTSPQEAQNEVESFFYLSIRVLFTQPIQFCPHKDDLEFMDSGPMQVFCQELWSIYSESQDEDLETSTAMLRKRFFSLAGELDSMSDIDYKSDSKLSSNY